MGGALSVAPESTWMFREAAEAPDVVRLQRQRNAETIGDLAERLRSSKPRAVVTLARGSSDHAATFARYLIETRAGLLTSSASPSVGSIYDSTPDLAGTVRKIAPTSRRVSNSPNGRKPLRSCCQTT